MAYIKISKTKINRRGSINQLVVKVLVLTVLVPMFSTAAFAAAPKKAASDSPFVAQSQISVTMMRSMRPVGMLQADVGILVTNQAQRARATALTPVLRDTWRRTTQEFANSSVTEGRPPDAVLLGQRLQSATDQIIGPGVARVLFTSLIVR
jgi:flagellar basal body-associated protein FliL